MSTDDDDEDPNKPPLFRKLASITNSSAVNKTSILLDATRYIQELKQKVEDRMTVAAANNPSSSTSSHPPPLLSDLQVEVETLERGGFLIKVLLERNSPGVLVSVLEAFENQLGLDVVDARVSSAHNFQFQAFARTHHQSDGGINAQLVKQAVVQAISNWMETSDDKDED